MWNPFRKKQQPVSNEEAYNKFMESMMKKADEEDRPYRSTNIGFGASVGNKI